MDPESYTAETPPIEPTQGTTLARADILTVIEDADAVTLPPPTDKAPVESDGSDK